MTIPSGYQLVWSDEFTNPPVDTTKWTVRDNCRPAYASCCSKSANATVSNGELILKCQRHVTNVTCDACNYGLSGANVPYSGVDMLTKGLHSWKYGYFEVSAKIPSVPSVWPAFWLQGSTATYYWEVDVFEYRGESNSVYHSILKGRYPTEPIIRGSPYNKHYVVDYGNTYHVFGFEWTPTFCKIWVDGSLKLTVTDTNWIPDKEMFIILGNILAGTILGGTFVNNQMNIQYVRVYQPTTLECPNPVLKMTI